MFTIYTGLRIGELIALRWKDIDFEKKFVKIEKSVEVVENPEYEEINKYPQNKYIYLEGDTKNYAHRSVSLPEQALRALEFRREYCKNKNQDDLVFTSLNGSYLNPSNLRMSLIKFYKYAMKNFKDGKYFDPDNIPTLSMHVLRHTCASMYFRHTNLKTEEIAANLGHSPDVCRTTYIHLVEERRVTGASQMSNINHQNIEFSAKNELPEPEPPKTQHIQQSNVNDQNIKLNVRIIGVLTEKYL